MTGLVIVIIIVLLLIWVRLGNILTFLEQLDNSWLHEPEESYWPDDK